MKNRKNSLTLLLAALIYSLSLNCLATSVIVEVEAVILPNSSVTTVNGLTFGSISVGGSAGTIAIGSDGEVEVEGQVSVKDVTETSAGKIIINGLAGVDFSISLPQTIQLENQSGNTMVVNSLSSSTGDGGKINANGKIEVGIGGKLQVKSAQPSGTYRGNLRIDVNY